MKRLRRSRQREEILRYLKSTDSHPTAQKVYEAILPEFPSLSLGTVYRNLNILEEQGTVRKLRLGSTFDRYDAITGYHSHFYCRVCERIYDLPVGSKPDFMAKAAESTSHLIEGYTVDFHGVCEQCLGEGKHEKTSQKTDKGEAGTSEASKG